jgi:hypothetical protein
LCRKRRKPRAGAHCNDETRLSVPDVIQPSQAVAWKSRPDVETTGAVRLLSSQSDYFGNIVSALTGWMQKAPIEPDQFAFFANRDQSCRQRD